jgi:hypothetical protein
MHALTLQSFLVRSALLLSVVGLVSFCGSDTQNNFSKRTRAAMYEFAQSPKLLPPSDPPKQPYPEQLPNPDTTRMVHYYFVAPNGNDSNPGTFAKPFKTFYKALINVKPGDTIYARGGTYTKDNSTVYSVGGVTTNTGYETELLNDGKYHVVQRCFIPLCTFAGAYSYAAYSVASGTSGLPITIRNYPDELPILDCTGFTNFSYANDLTYPIPKAVNIQAHSFFTIDGFESVGGIFNLAATATRLSANHDITIQNCNIHDVTCDGGDNVGLIRIDRSAIGGPYNILIQNNKLHDLYDWASPGSITPKDFGHFGGVTVLSTECYTGTRNGGTGKIEILNNEIYNIPQSLFFKNPMSGPVGISNNKIHNCSYLGQMAASNVNFIHNLIYSVPGFFWNIGGGGEHVGGLSGDALAAEKAALTLIAGTNIHIEYNTFVGSNNIVKISQGSTYLYGQNPDPPTLRNNIIFGLIGRVSQGANMYIFCGGDGNTDETSTMNLFVSDYNGFISPYANWEHTYRGKQDQTSHYYTKAQAQSTFGLDVHSVVMQEADAANIFIDPANHDYRLRNPSRFLGMGYYAYHKSATD